LKDALNGCRKEVLMKGVNELRLSWLRWFVAAFIGSVVLVALTALTLGSAPVATAHESRSVQGENGEYNLEIGFQNEPAYEGVLNGVELTITPLNGSPALPPDTDLVAEVAYIPTGETLELPLEPHYSEAGVLVAEFAPSTPGDYRFRIFGTLDSTAIDQTFVSGPDTFSPVMSARDLIFPSHPSAREIANLAVANQTALADVRSDLDGLRIGIGAVGAALGLNLLVLAAVLITLRRFNARQSREAARDG